ncbi:Protein SERAC1, partial [Colletotrichum tanaceti]
KIKRLAARARASHKARENENPHGFFQVYEPENGQPCAEIVLVHGLGGTSQKTWTWPDDPHCFWPREMCNLDPLQMARVWTHGYPADGLKRPMTKSVADINDFAEDFLNHLKDEVDKLPIIFIAHSLGGIVVKKACVLGANSQEYQDVISSACAVFFLGTPHKGATIADKIINCMKKVGVTAAPHVTPLRRNSPEFKKIHDDFKPFSERLDIATFYELKKMGLFGLGAQAEFTIQWKALVTHEASMWSSEQSYVARQALTWITYAKDPLEVEQLVQAIAVSTAKRVELRDIRKILGHLVTIDECSKLRLSHRSAVWVSTRSPRGTIIFA